MAIIGSLPDIPAGCLSEFLMTIPAVAVVSPEHPLAKLAVPVLRSVAEDYVQLVLADRSPLTVGRNFGVMSAKTWRLGDMGAKHAFLRAGLGWGYMPLPVVKQDLANGTLVTLNLEVQPDIGTGFSMHALHLIEYPPGPAGRWFVNMLKKTLI
ncbi:LysR substrate-binding domain-containing protein [Enterobacter cloacae]|uniref:LysR substrate-binding domain-containing protein n=1 Tax=Enterobacter cloacae TaxID=550 RepID=UPI0028894425|nr:LysR substrate-binding domain-containing protein [Enterobacter cloacae]WNJ09262.1 LysR substrate-binding domain-containing protein [Enterobacter cloacae]